MLVYLGLLLLAILAATAVALVVTRRGTHRVRTGRAATPTDLPRDITLAEYVSATPHPLHGTPHAPHESR